MATQGKARAVGSRLEVPDDWGLAGKVAIVTGGGAAGDGIGNGRAASILLAKAGVRVVVVDSAAEPAAMMEALGGEAIAFKADVTRPEECRATVEAALDHFGRLDLLDNNVGIGSRGWDVGLAVRFLLSDHARYITGQTLVVDGGATLSGPERGT